MAGVLAAVAVRIAGNRALDAVPGIAGRVLGLVPRLLGRALGVLPAALQVVLGLVPGPIGVAGPGLPAILVGGLVVLVVTAFLGVGPRAVVLAPVGVLLGRIDGFGDAVADEASGNGSDRRSNQGADDRPAHHRTDGSARGGASRGTCTAADRMYLVLVVVHEVSPLKSVWRPVLASPSRHCKGGASSLAPDRLHRIRVHRAPGGRPAGGERYAQEEEGDAHEARRIGRTDAVERL